jgi:phospholipid N-methyltransferase
VTIPLEFLRHPMRTGALTESSRYLADAASSGLGLERARLVVELGPGTGVVTRAILAKIPAGATLTAIELNPRLAEQVRAGLKDDRLTVVDGSAVDIRELVADPVDAVVSGLPWTLMPAELQSRTLDAVAGALASDGRFSTYTYVTAVWTPPGRRFAAELARRFQAVQRGAIVWRNVPPAFVYRAWLRPPEGPG